MEDAARASLSLIGPSTVVQTIQNGLGSAELVAAIVNPNQLAVGVVGGFGASLVIPGHVHHNGMEMVRFGSYAGLSRDDLQRVANIWESSGFTVKLFTDTDQMVWEKLILNVAFSATTCLSGFTIGQVLANEHLWKVARSCIEEAVHIATAKGINLNVDDPIAYVSALGHKIADARPSMLLDHLAHRRSEIDVINGAISSEAAKVGLSAPVNATVTSLVKAREEEFAS